MDGFARRKEQSKEDIRKAAWELFGQFGVEKVSVNDIARKANVSHATIYNNFGSKEVLVREFVTAMVEHLVDKIQEILAPNKQFDQKMTAFFQFISEMLVDNRSMAESPIFTSSVDLQNDPDIRQIREAAQERTTNLLLELFAEGKQQGRVNPNLSDEVLIIYFKMFMDMFIRPELHYPFRQNPQMITDLGWLMMHGLGRVETP
ncbi:MAG: TetR/AcrR family transcriptional regulator [Chloroflexi bacterium]|nr:TetR/AcrR family transcriptional regulator [Chloroflexota bacterium]MBP7042068.1 TetR/AcrR family transcriptional regulator [Chloroflexota bacterium]